MGQVKILSASAGSGKTYRLAYRYIEVAILNPYNYSRILAVTFTNKATDEMKQRILQELNLLACGQTTSFLKDLMKDHPSFGPDEIQRRALMARTLILHNYSNFAVMTIDRFFQRVVRSFMQELGIELNYTLELKTEDLISTATDNLIEGIASESPLELAMDKFIEERINENRDWDLRRNIKELGKQLFDESYLQSPKYTGSEELISLKQQLISKRSLIRENVVNIARTALDTIATAGLEIGDFSRGKIIKYLPKWTTDEPFPPYDKLETWIVSAIDKPDTWLNAKSKHRIGSIYPAVNETLRAMVTELRRLTTLDIILDNFDEYVLLADLKRNLDELCSNKNILPLSKTSQLIKALIKGSDAPFIYEKVGSRFDYYMIDEFQDTSHSQWNNFKPLIKESISSIEDQSVLLVGDVKQSIYRWRGGDWRILANDVEEYLSTISPDCIDFDPMQTNYRSWKRIVEFNNALTSSVVEQLNSVISATLQEAYSKEQITADEYKRLVSMIPQAYADYEQKANDDSTRGYVTLCTYDKRDNQDPPIIERIKELQDRGYRPEDIGIIIRTNEQGYQIANILLEYKAKHPDTPYCFDIVTEEALRIDSSSSVQFIIACLRLSQNAEDTIFRAVFNKFLGRAYDDKISAEELEFILSLASKSPEQAFESIVMRYDLGRQKEALAYIQALHQQILSFSSNKIADIPLFLRMWDERGCSESLVMPSGTAAITIITIHKSKGLAYKAVIIPMASWLYRKNNGDMQWLQSDISGSDCIFPLSLPKSSSDTEFAYHYYNDTVMQAIDALNMLYVAVTRAKCELHIMYPAIIKRDPNMGVIIDSIIPKLVSSLEKQGDVKFTAASDTTPTFLSYGTPIDNTDVEKEEKSLSLDNYITSEIASKIRLHTPSERYSEDCQPTLSPRDLGIMMHSIFQEARTKEDILKGIENLRTNLTATPEQCDMLISKIERAFSNPLVEEWFSSDWQFIRNECDILTPKDGKFYRPDRVMVQDNRAVVIDYKFGFKTKESHREQIEEYATLLRQMGYTQIEGYLWYVNLDKREQVI